MAEQLAEKQVCRTCGADVRPGALFCYNCGSSVAMPLVREAAESRLDSTGSTLSDVKVNAQISAEKKISGRETKRKFNSRGKLKTAAALRDKNKPLAKKPVEVTWEPPQNRSNIWFLIVSLILVLFATGILLAMLFIR